ncbi:MAG: mycofactocin biosynthesis glycosyltransferase MftF [Acidimicrobiales bacterium]
MSESTDVTSDAVLVPPLPTDCTIEPASDLRSLAQGRILIGGAPLTITRLSDAGGALVSGWFAGAPISDNPKHQALARRLLRAGMAHTTPSHHSVDPGRLSVIIPVKDDQAGLDATLEALLGHEVHAGAEAEADLALSSLVVVDDGSAPLAQIADHGPGVSVLRHERALGPGQARQAGLRLIKSEPTGSDLVAFIDAGVLVTASDLLQLAAAFDDPAVVAAAPRVASIAADNLVARFDLNRSPLDLGPGQSLVGPGRHVPYVPSACLVVRADRLEEAGGFDPALRYGEDVDLVWRLAALGDVVYLPSVVVQHPARPTLASMARQRRSYGSAAAPLAVRHGEAVAPVKISPWSALVFLLAIAGRPVVALATAAGTALALRPKIEPLPDLTAEAFLLTARGHWYGGLSVLTATVRAWSPIVALGWLIMPSQRRRLATVVAAAFARRLLDGPKAPADAVRDVALGAVDDLAYCTGVWEGVVKQRSRTALAALAPALSSWPKPGAGGSKPPS